MQDSGEFFIKDNEMGHYKEREAVSFYKSYMCVKTIKHCNPKTQRSCACLESSFG